MDDEDALLYGDGGDDDGQAENEEQLKETIESTQFQLEQETGDPVSINCLNFLLRKGLHNK